MNDSPQPDQIEQLCEQAASNGAAIPPYFRYWGKAKPAQDAQPQYHLLPYHCLDVAAVGYLLLAPEKPRCQQLSRQLQVDSDWLRQFFVFCLALHDLGKFSRAFQGLMQGQSTELVKGNSLLQYSVRHDSLGFLVWREVIESAFPDVVAAAGLGDQGVNDAVRHIEPWLEIVTGHHGMPPKKHIKRVQNFYEVDDEKAVLVFVQESCRLFLNGFDFSALGNKTLKKRLQTASWQLAGVAVLADWLGSNQDYFSYCNKPQNLDDYWQVTALSSAARALEALPEAPAIAPFTQIQNLFPFIHQPTPLQQYAVSEPLTDTPQLFILEDVTGAGKTEAALTLTHRLISQGLAEGLYVALPTMATANAMYQRLGKVYRQFYRGNTSPSLILAHGARQLSEAFRASVVLPSQSQQDSDYQQGMSEQEQELSASAYCNAWLADNRKKALLADVGVGTLDQALLAVLPARHQSLRLLGLNRKVLLIDEVHAYDSYMQHLLNALLEAHARQGGSAILLSATLPHDMRRHLVAAFHKGLGEAEPIVNSGAYPLVTHSPAIRAVEQAVETREQVKRTVRVERLQSEDEALQKIKHAVEMGQAVCWIRNTVKAARHSYQTLLASGVSAAKLNLFHSRFAMQDRLSIEDQVLTRFGEGSTHAQREGQILIATQVVEQSLDLDFDLLLTDLAPIDLLIQRAGRLQRHVRNRQGERLREPHASDQRGTPVLYVLSPAPDLDADASWLKQQQPGTQAVYPHVGQLWLTTRLLFADSQSQFTLPEDARRLIEGVYSSASEAAIPEAVMTASLDAEGKSLVQKSMAELNVLKLHKGYTHSSGDWGEETRIPTRLTEQETVPVALVRLIDGVLKPYADGAYGAWALSTINLPGNTWLQAQRDIPEHLKPSIETLKAETKALRWLEVFPLCPETQAHYSTSDGWQT